LLDPRFVVSGGVAIDPAAYEAAVAAAGQIVPGISGRTDTEFKLVFPERAGFDDAYVKALVDRDIVDEDFVLDVLAIDFTRPLFSDARCGLLSFAPTATAAEPDAIRDAFVTALQKAAPAAGTPGASLLANLMDPADADAHRDRAKAFVAACDARDDRQLADDLLRFLQLTRNLVKTTTSLIEHQEQLASTSLPVASSAHLDPTTCTLVD
jgi:hypothetical protein